MEQNILYQPILVYRFKMFQIHIYIYIYIKLKKLLKKVSHFFIFLIKIFGTTTLSCSRNYVY